MYVNITGSKNNKDVYITQSYRKPNGKTSSRIYRKLGKYNDLLEQRSRCSAKPEPTIAGRTLVVGSPKKNRPQTMRDIMSVVI